MLDSTLTLIVVTALLLGSPGPAPLALAGTSAIFGVKRGVPFLLGILAGLAIAIIAAFLGMAALFVAYPGTKLLLQVLGGLYILVIAYKIASAPILADDALQPAHIPSFTDGFILNLFNPKAYAAFIAIFSQFLVPVGNEFLSTLFTGGVCLLVAAVVDVLWLCSGQLVSSLFRRSATARPIRIVFAVSMIASVAWAFIQ